MSERTEAELARILSGASATVAASLAIARSRMRPPGRQVPPAPPLPEGSSAASEGDLLADRVLWHPSWDGAALRRLCGQLGDRRLFAVEPVPTLGTARLGQRLLGPYWRRRLGHDFEADVPRELRRAGFQIFVIDRFAVDPLGLQTYAYLEVGPRLVPPVR
ncbi:MAG: hypothetical protein AAFN30_00495 [Actinomycetota bacterium]